MEENSYAKLRNNGRYTQFIYKDTVITFMHGKDLQRYIKVKEWDDGYLVVDCLGTVMGKYEDYIDMRYILENLYMDPEEYLKDVKGVVIDDV